MKKGLSILALAILTLGFTSCEAETNLEETDALYEVDQYAGEDDADPDPNKGKRSNG